MHRILPWLALGLLLAPACASDDGASKTDPLLSGTVDDDEALKSIEKTIFQMEELIENYDEIGVNELVRSDLAFHSAMGDAAQNRLVQKIYSFVMDFFKPSIRITHEKERGGRKALFHHQMIFTALKDRDEAGAVEAVEASIVAWKNLSHTRGGTSLNR